MVKGKAFEQQFRKDWINTVENSFIYRLNDQVSGFKGTSKNLCDFICFKSPRLYIIDCKSHAGNSIPLSAVSQLDMMQLYSGTKDVVLGTIVWFYDHKDLVVWIPIETWLKLKDEGKKSFNIKMIDEYECCIIPSKFKRTFCDSDYSYLIKYYEEK